MVFNEKRCQTAQTPMYAMHASLQPCVAVWRVAPTSSTGGELECGSIWCDFPGSRLHAFGHEMCLITETAFNLCQYKNH